MKIFIHANCQGGPLKKILDRRLSKDKEIIFYKPVHELNTDDQANFFSLLESSDVIISQNISDAFGELYSTKYIENRFSQKTHLTIPVAYFNGYYPSCTYIREVKGLNKFTDYHDKELISLFLSGYSVGDALSYKMESKNGFPNAVEESISELSRRELNCDVEISSYIKNHFSDRRLFWTVNHPDNYLIDYLSKSIISALGLKDQHQLDLIFGREFLGDTVLPINRMIRLSYDLKFDSRIIIKGKVYDLPSYISNYYAIYKHNHELLNKISEKYRAALS